jgi:hypothetical protein
MIHPLVSFLLSEGGFNKKIHHWPSLAERFEIKSENEDTPRAHGKVAFYKWKNFLGTARGLEFKKANVNPMTGEVTSLTFGRASEPEKLPSLEGGRIKFVTTTPNGGAFVRTEYESNAPPPITDEQRADIEKKVNQKPIQIPKLAFHQNFLVIGCVHRPFHDKKLWDSLISFVHASRGTLHGLIINGDYLDMKSLSSHDEKKVLPDGINLGIEYRDGYEGIMELKHAFGDEWESIVKHYTYGNHEARYFKHIGQFDNSKYGTALMSPHAALNLEEEGFCLQLDWENGMVEIGDDLEAFHGFFTGPNAIKKHLERSNKNVLFNHTHQVGEFKLGGRIGHNIGWMGDETSAGFTYANRFTLSGWQKSFAIVNLLSSGRSIVNRIACFNGGFFIGNNAY